MKPVISTALALAVALVLAAGPARRAGADDETDEVEIKVEAPLVASNCNGTPPTITVLGLEIDISAAVTESGLAGCAALTAGQTVEVDLASDAVPLAATQVAEQGSTNEAKIQAPVQAVDAVGATIRVLGLTVDVSGAKLEGADDQDDGNDQPVDLSQLMVGQFVEVTLDVAKLPTLVATQVEVKNFTNEADVEVVGPNGEDIDDMDQSGNPEDDIDVEVVETVQVRGASPASGPGALSVASLQASGAPGRVKKILHFQTKTNGRFTLHGLPTGRAKITATRVRNGSTTVGQRRLRVKGNRARIVRLVLR